MGRRENSGRYVQHEDGRKGILYHRDPVKDGKALVYFEKEPDSFEFTEKAQVDASKLTVIGFSD